MTAGGERRRGGAGTADKAPFTCVTLHSWYPGGTYRAALGGSHNTGCLGAQIGSQHAKSLEPRKIK